MKFVVFNETVLLLITFLAINNPKGVPNSLELSIIFKIIIPAEHLGGLFG